MKNENLPKIDLSTIHAKDRQDCAYKSLFEELIQIVTNLPVKNHDIENYLKVKVQELKQKHQIK